MCEYYETYDEQWEKYWKRICTKENGELDLEQIKKELHDFSFLIENATKVYTNVTGYKISKLTTPADVVNAVADDYFNETLEEEIKEHIKYNKDEICNTKDKTLSELKSKLLEYRSALWKEYETYKKYPDKTSSGVALAMTQFDIHFEDLY